MKLKETVNTSRLRRHTEGSKGRRQGRPQRQQRQLVEDTRGDGGGDSDDKRQRGKGDFASCTLLQMQYIYMDSSGALGVGFRK